MARVVLTPGVQAQFPAAPGTLEVDALNLFRLAAALDARFPGMGPWLEARAAFAVDGLAVQDWSQRLGESSEVLILPRIAGG